MSPWRSRAILGIKLRMLAKRAILCGMGIGVSIALQGQPHPTPPETSKLPTPQDLLVRSYDIGRSFTTAERVYLMIFLDDAGGEMKFQRTAQWAEEQFRLTFQLPHDWSRVAAQKNALADLSYYDPTRALQLFRGMDLPVALNGRFPEDLRASGARVIFMNYWQEKKPKGLDTLRSQAKQLARTGQYPYEAMTEIIESSSLKEGQVRAIVEDASAAYQRGSRFESEDYAYVSFLKAVQSRTPPDVFRRSLGYAADRLINGDADKSIHYTANTYTSKGTVSFTSLQESLLFDLLPIAQKVDPDMAEKILRARPRLGPVAGAEVKAEEGVGVPTKDPPSASVRLRALERSRVEEVATIASKDPNQALLLAQSISDPALKATALAYVAGGLELTAPDQAAQMISMLKDDADKLDTGPSKVTMLTALAEAAAKAKDVSSFEFAFQRAFDLGTELWEEEVELHPAKPGYDTRVFDDLRNLIKIGIQMHPGRTLDAISELQSDVLQAYLLIDAALALYRFPPVSQ